MPTTRNENDHLFFEEPLGVDKGIYVRNEDAGYSGYSGYSGTSGVYYALYVRDGQLKLQSDSGVEAPAGISGYSGFSGTSGYSGPTGASGYSGDSGISGYSGADGAAGTSGYSGYSGQAGGESGTSGFSGYSGISGAAGDSGISGYSGYSGVNPLQVQAQNLVNEDQTTSWSEPTFNINGNFTKIEQWTNGAKGTKLYTRDITYSGTDVTQIATTDEQASKTLTKDYYYSGSGLSGWSGTWA